MKQKTNRKPVVKADLFREVTDKMIAALESGTPPWRQAWQSGNEGLPANAVTGRRYDGINVMLLWSDAVNKGYERNRWLTFRQAREAGEMYAEGRNPRLWSCSNRFRKQRRMSTAG